MAQEDTNIASDPNATSFISSGKSDGAVDSTYSDFFQETSDGNISVWPKAQKSGLEIFTNIAGYLLPVIIIGVLLWAFHVYVQGGGGANTIKENYTFLCGYLNYGVNNFDEEHKCSTMESIAAAYTQKRSELEEDIVVKLNEYIPIKLTKNILLTSPERKFTIEKYNNKLHMDEVMQKFEEVKNASKSTNKDNITCNGLSIAGDGNITTQCTIYGDISGSDDENGRLGSARIEAIRFLSNVSDTSKSQFILLNPPTSLSMEKLEDDESGFATSTTVSIQALYVSFNKEKL